MALYRWIPLLALSCGLAASAQTAPTASPNAIKNGLGQLRSLPEAQRGPRTGELARQIAALPPGKDKDSLAIALSHLSTEGDPGRDNLQAVTTTLGQALIETPVPVKGDIAYGPYSKLAELVRYEGMTVPDAITSSPDYKAAMDRLVAEDDAVSKADFTLRDTHGKKWTMSQLRGKVVMVNFWATWCPPCRMELPNLDVIAAHFAPLGLVILAVTDEDIMKVNDMFRGRDPHFVILLDDGHKVGKQFNVSGIPRTFVFNREGKLAAEGVDARTQRQFLTMLGKAGLSMSAAPAAQTGQ